MLVTLSNKYLRLKTKNYVVYFPTKDYNELFPYDIHGSYSYRGIKNISFRGIKKNISYFLHTLSEEQQSEMEIEVRSCQSVDGILYEHKFEYVEFDKETIKMTKRLENDNPIKEDVINMDEKIKMSSIVYMTANSYKNPWERIFKIKKIKNSLKG